MKNLFPLLTPNRNLEDDIMNRIYQSKSKAIVINLFDYKKSKKEIPYPSYEGLNHQSTYANGDMKLLASNHQNFSYQNQSISYSGETVSYSVTGTSYPWNSQTTADPFSSAYIDRTILGKPTPKQMENSISSMIVNTIHNTLPNVTEHYEINQQIPFNKYMLLIPILERNHHNYKFMLEIKTNEDILNIIERELPYLIVSTPKQTKKLKITLHKETEGCSKCGIHILAFKGESEYFQATDEEMSSLRIELPSISSLNIEKKSITLKDSFDDIPMKKQTSKEIMFRDTYISVANNNLKFKLEKCLVTETKYHFTLMFEYDKNIEPHILIPNANLVIGHNIYPSTHIDVKTLTENCKKCGNYILGYEIHIQFERCENFSAFELDIPYIRLTEKDVINIHLFNKKKNAD